MARVEVACVGGGRHGSGDDGGVEKWHFHGRFVAARGGAHDIAIHGGFGCFGGGF